MNRDQVLNALFGESWKAEHLEPDHFYGRASMGNQEVTVIGTSEKAEVGADMALTMARITKIPLEQLQELAKQSPVFSPGVENYLRMGHLDAVWEGDYAAQLAASISALQAKSRAEIAADSRIARGVERGGRKAAGVVIERVLGHA
jgi:malonate decarboxylase gamma subunit